MTIDHPAVTDRILDQWQEATNILSALCGVPSALIMRKNSDSMEVISSSNHPDTPYKANEKAPLNGELYCETVIETQQPLHVINALADPDWDHNPDIDLGMIFYYGIPINWPDKTPFGTVCILDSKAINLTKKQQELIAHFGNIIELSLELIVKNHTLEKVSQLDGLTQISNRAFFDRTLESEWQRGIREQTPLSLIFCDIDFFKLYNDHEGHIKGDECLKAIALSLASTCNRATDICARYGGEEFVIILPNTDSNGAQLIAELCQKNINTLSIPHNNSPISDTVTISIGICTMLPTNKQQAIELVQNADTALYTAKQKARNMICRFEQ